MEVSRSTRRSFLHSSAALLAAGPVFAGNSANDRIRIAVVGLRGRGRDHIAALHRLAGANVEIAALCDVDAALLQQRLAGYEKLSGRRPAGAADIRRVLDDRSIDAITFATPNHWHALGAVWACQAGKDVYVEKPGTHAFAEGGRIIRAAHRYGRIVQHGTQHRSSPNMVEAMEKLREGVIGRVYLARGIGCKGPRVNVGRIQAEAAPSGLDWDAWQGPAPAQPYAKAVHRGWHRLWDYGNGDIGSQGVHELDIMRCALGLNTNPTRIAAMGGQFSCAEGGLAPEVHTVTYEWAGRDLSVTFEMRSGPVNTQAGNKNVAGVIFMGTDGFMILPDYSSYRTFLGPKREPGPSQTGLGDMATQRHFQNFIQAMRSRKPGELNAGPEELHLSAALAHFANIAYRTGRTLQFDAAAERFTDDRAASRLLERTYRAPYLMS